jgi:hypothetical protein
MVGEQFGRNEIRLLNRSVIVASTDSGQHLFPKPGKVLL